MVEVLSQRREVGNIESDSIQNSAALGGCRESVMLCGHVSGYLLFKSIMKGGVCD